MDGTPGSGGIGQARARLRVVGHRAMSVTTMSDIAAEPARSPFAGLRLGLHRNRRNMLFAFLGTTALFGAVAALLPPAYKAESVLMVRLGPEYLVNGDPASTYLYQENKEIIASEAGMLETPQLAMQVINKVGLGRLYPGIADDIDPADPDTASDAMERAILKFGKNLNVLPIKDTTLIDATFKNADPQVASDALQAAVVFYLQNRKKVFEYGDGGTMGIPVGQALQVLRQKTEELEQIKQTYGITDIDKQYTILFDEKEDLTRTANAARVDIAAQGGQIAVLGPIVANADFIVSQTSSRAGPAQLDVRDAAAKLQLQRTGMLLTYKPGTPQIQDIDNQIRMTQSLLHSFGGDRDVTTIKTMPPAYTSSAQALAAAQAQMEASTRSLQVAEAKIAEVSAEIAKIDGARLSFDQKTQEVQAAQDAYAQAAKRASEAMAHDQMLEATKPNVEVVQAARPPYKETPIRLIIAGAGVVLGLLLAGTILYLDNASRSWRTQ
jgi:uncharacterized protein involved in exopolysaccharide biosynthesis